MTDERYLLYINIDSNDFFDDFPEWKKYYGDYYRNGSGKYVRQKPILFMQMLAGVAASDSNYSTIGFAIKNYNSKIFNKSVNKFVTFTLQSDFMNPHFVDAYIILSENN